MGCPRELEEVLGHAAVRADNNNLGQHHNDLAVQVSGREEFVDRGVVPLGLP